MLFIIFFSTDIKIINSIISCVCKFRQKTCPDIDIKNYICHRIN